MTATPVKPNIGKKTTDTCLQCFPDALSNCLFVQELDRISGWQADTHAFLPLLL